MSLIQFTLLCCVPLLLALFVDGYLTDRKRRIHATLECLIFEVSLYMYTVRRLESLLYRLRNNVYVGDLETDVYEIRQGLRHHRRAIFFTCAFGQLHYLADQRLLLEHMHAFSQAQDIVEDYWQLYYSTYAKDEIPLRVSF